MFYLKLDFAVECYKLNETSLLKLDYCNKNNFFNSNR
jgi:hypothetical protein